MYYTDPNEIWRHHLNPRDDMSDDERMAVSILHVVVTFVMLMAGLLLCVLFSSCTTTQYVPVAEQRTEHHWHTDSVKERDSIHTENTTIIREVDSAAMAKYGIQMQNNQRAWLVLQREIDQRLRELEHMTATKDTVRDSVPIPYPVVKEVPAKMSQWQKWLMWIGLATVMGIIVWVMNKVRRFLPGV